MLGEALSTEERIVIEHARDYLSRITPNTSVVQKFGYSDTAVQIRFGIRVVITLSLAYTQQ